MDLIGFDEEEEEEEEELDKEIKEITEKYQKMMMKKLDDEDEDVVDDEEEEREKEIDQKGVNDEDVVEEEEREKEIDQKGVNDEDVDDDDDEDGKERDKEIDQKGVLDVDESAAESSNADPQLTVDNSSIVIHGDDVEEEQRVDSEAQTDGSDLQRTTETEFEQKDDEDDLERGGRTERGLIIQDEVKENKEEREKEKRPSVFEVGSSSSSTPPPRIFDPPVDPPPPPRRDASAQTEEDEQTSNPQAASPVTTLNPQAAAPGTTSNPQAAAPGTTSNPQAAALGTTGFSQRRTIQQILNVRDDGDDPPNPEVAQRRTIQQILNDGDDEDDPPDVSIFILNPDSWWYRLWSYFIIVLAVFSSFFMPLEFAFRTDFPEGSLSIIDLVVGVFFFLDILVQFLTSYRDDQTDLMVNRHKPIAIRCLRSYVIYFELLACCPWDFLYAVYGRTELVRYGLWFRVYRAFKVMTFFQNIGMNYRIIRILKSFVILLYYIHTGGCIFYHLATIVPEHRAMYTWIGSMMGAHFRQIAFGRRYVLSFYFAVVTVSTVGYGDVHAVTDIEMIFTSIYVLLSMGVIPYLTNLAL